MDMYQSRTEASVDGMKAKKRKHKSFLSAFFGSVPATSNSQDTTKSNLKAMANHEYDGCIDTNTTFSAPCDQEVSISDQNDANEKLERERLYMASDDSQKYSAPTLYPSLPPLTPTAPPLEDNNDWTSTPSFQTHLQTTARASTGRNAGNNQNGLGVAVVLLIGAAIWYVLSWKLVLFLLAFAVVFGIFVLAGGHVIAVASLIAVCVIGPIAAISKVILGLSDKENTTGHEVQQENNHWHQTNSWNPITTLAGFIAQLLLLPVTVPILIVQHMIQHSQRHTSSFLTGRHQSSHRQRNNSNTRNCVKAFIEHLISEYKKPANQRAPNYQTDTMGDDRRNNKPSRHCSLLRLFVSSFITHKSKNGSKNSGCQTQKSTYLSHNTKTTDVDFSSRRQPHSKCRTSYSSSGPQTSRSRHYPSRPSRGCDLCRLLFQKRK